MASFFDIKHPLYNEKAYKFQYIQDHYSGEVVNGIDSDNALSKIDEYLIKRTQGESDDAFSERKKLADYTPLFGLIVDRFAGMLFSNDSKSERAWFDSENPALGLGNPEDPTSPAYTLNQSADGAGTNWEVLIREAIIRLIEKQEVFILADGMNEGNKQASIKIINPLDVWDWKEEAGRLTEVKVSEKYYKRGSLLEPAVLTKRIVLYTLDGWKRFEQSEDSTELIEEGFYHFEDSAGNRILPIYRIILPLKRNISYLLARKNNVIFNKESDRDHLLRVANFPKINIVGNDTEFKNITTKLAAGSNALQLNPSVSGSTKHEYIAPDTAPAEIAGKVLRDKIEDFFTSAFQEYSNTGSQKSATEIRQDTAEGIAAFLSLLAASADELENGAFWRLEQIYFAKYTFENGSRVEQNDSIRENWGKAFVKRSQDFNPVDVDKQTKELKDLIFGLGEIPSDINSKVQAAEKILGRYSINYDAEALRLAIEAREAQEAQGADLNRFLGQ